MIRDILSGYENRHNDTALGVRTRAAADSDSSHNGRDGYRVRLKELGRRQPASLKKVLGASLLVASLFLPYSAYAAGLAFDTVAHAAANPTTALTFALTTAQAGDCIVLFTQSDTTGDKTTTATYAGASFTKLDNLQFQANGDGRFHQTWVLTNAANGNNNVVVNSANFLVSAIALAYSGADTTNCSDGHSTNTGTGTSLSSSVTTTNTNDFLVGVGENGNSNAVTITSGNLRYIDNVVSNGTYGDSSAPTAGSNSLGFTASTSVAWSEMVVAIQPPAATTRPNFGVLNFFGWF